MERGGQPHAGLNADVVWREFFDDVAAGPRRIA